MKRLLQSFDFRISSYERPNQNWICGNSPEGKACRLGPDRRGRCRATFECAPRRDGSRWHCTRAPSAGGPCEDGPLPDGTCCLSIPTCAPFRSLRAKRRIAASWATALAVGLLAIVLGGAGIGEVLSPGPITLQHSQVGDCSGCHQAFAKGPLNWVHAAVDGRNALAESQRCLDCHTGEDHAFAAHSVSPKLLSVAAGPADLAAAANGAPLPQRLTRLLFDQPMEATAQFACGTCHKEHRGSDADLKLMSNGQCQACHTKTFTSFADGHPDFGAYPYTRRTRLNFDHHSHIEKHFVKAGAEKAPKTCTTCHLPADDGDVMLVRGFDQACASCHLSQIEGEGLSGAKGIVFLTVPGLDLETLRERGIEIGQWPEFSEERITPFLRLLLAGEPAVASALDRVAGLDLLDLTDATPEDLEAVGTVAWAVKTLMHDALFESMAPLGETIADSLGQDMAPGRLSDLLGAVPLDVVRGAQEAWFPDLLREVALGRTGLAREMAATRLAGSVSAASGEEGAEPAASETAAQDDEILSDDDEILSDDDEILSDDDEILADDDEILSDDEEILSDDDDILSEDDEILSEDDEEILADDGDILSDEDEILSDDGDILADEDLADEDLADEDLADGDLADGDLADGGAAPVEGVEEAPLEVEVADLSALDVEAWAKLGGWYRFDYALYFKPTGHRDPFLRAWLDLSAGAAERNATGAAIFAALSHKNAPGRCTKCHSVDRFAGDPSAAAAHAGGAAQVNWTPKGAPAGDWVPTVFSHISHFSLLDQEGCKTCHKLDPGAHYAVAFEQTDPTLFASNFQPLDQAICADCHVANEAGDSCLGCHTYHIGRFPGPVVQTLMYGEGKAPEDPAADPAVATE